MADEEEVVCTLSYPGEAVATDLRYDAEMEDVSEDFWGHACDVQQRIASAFESDDFCIQGQDGVEVDLAAIPDGKTSVRVHKYLGTRSLTLTVVGVVVGGRCHATCRIVFPTPAAEPSEKNVSTKQRRLRQVFQSHP